MKYNIRIVFAVFAILITSLIACSPDSVEEVETEPAETEMTPPQPDWADGTITITTGRGDSEASLLAGLEASRCQASVVLKNILFDENPATHVPVSQIEREIEVSIVLMTEVGATRPMEMPEVIKYYRAAGYRPVTLEEAIELRIQFWDQPYISEEKVSAFFALLSEEARKPLFAPWLGGQVRTFETVQLYRYKKKDLKRIVLTGKRKYDPHQSPPMISDLGIELFVPGGTRFACVKIKE